MNRLSKSFGKGTSIRPVLKDVSLSFYPGAKIGVLGSNGSGKSTLMKVRGRILSYRGAERATDSTTAPFVDVFRVCRASCWRAGGAEQQYQQLSVLLLVLRI